MTGTAASDSNLLGVYLNDHLAGATGGVIVARRVAKTGQGARALTLRAIAEQIGEDRDT